MRSFADLLRSVHPFDPAMLRPDSSSASSVDTITVDSCSGSSSGGSGTRTPTNAETALRPAPQSRRPPRTPEMEDGEEESFRPLQPSRSASSTASSVIRLALPEDEAREGLPYTILTGGAPGGDRGTLVFGVT
jgi:hypothetical protein